MAPKIGPQGKDGAQTGSKVAWKRTTPSFCYGEAGWVRSPVTNDGGAASILGHFLSNLALDIRIRSDVEVEVVLIDVHHLNAVPLRVLREGVVTLDHFRVIDDTFPVAVVQLGHTNEREESWRIDFID